MDHFATKVLVENVKLQMKMITYEN